MSMSSNSFSLLGYNGVVAPTAGQTREEKVAARKRRAADVSEKKAARSRVSRDYNQEVKQLKHRAVAARERVGEMSTMALLDAKAEYDRKVRLIKSQKVTLSFPWQFSLFHFRKIT